MPTTRTQQFLITTNPAVQQQLAGALLSAAVNVLNEPADTTNHANRLAFASAIFDDPAAQAGRSVNYLLTNTTNAANAGNPVSESGTPFPDEDIDFTVASLFDTLANKFAGA